MLVLWIDKVCKQSQINENINTLTVSSAADNNKIASFDLEENSVIASNPAPLDKEQWRTIVSRTQANIQAAENKRKGGGEEDPGDYD